MSTPDKQQYVRSAIHKSGGINKSLLTPYKRIGLSRNINKLFKSPLITNESDVLKTLSNISSSSTPMSTPTKSEHTRTDETPKKLDTPIPSRSLQNKHSKKAKIKPRVSFTKKLDIIEDECNNKVQIGDFADNDSEPLIVLKKTDIIPLKATNTPKIKSASTPEPQVTSNISIEEKANNSICDKPPKKDRNKLKKRLSLKRSNSDIALSDSDTKKLDIIEDECNSKVQSDDFVDSDSEPLIVLKKTDMPSKATNTTKIMSGSTPEPQVTSNISIEEKSIDSVCDKPLKKHRNKLKKQLSLKRSNSDLALSDIDDDFICKKQKKNRISSNSSFSMDCKVKLEKLPSGTILDSLNMDVTPTNSQSEVNSQKESSSTILEGLKMDTNSDTEVKSQNQPSSRILEGSPINTQNDIKLLKMSSSTILEGLNINSTPTNSQTDETTTTPMAILIKNVQDLENSIKAKMKKLEGLKQAALYKKKHNVGKLRGEVGVWMNGCKQALEALHRRLQENGPITMGALMTRLNIPADMFKYDKENDCLL